MKKVVLYIEDELALAGIIRERLKNEGFDVLHADSEHRGIKLFEENHIDIVVLDIMLNEGDGYSLARVIRSTDKEIPIIFLSAKSQAKDVIEGFKSGGNDYMRKPFSAEELLIRMKALLNSSRLVISPEKKENFEFGKFRFNARMQELSTDQSMRALTGRESQLLHMLCLHKQSLVSKKSLLLEIWGDDSFFNSRSLDVFISRLRKYLAEDSSVKIQNIRGYGYKLIY